MMSALIQTSSHQRNRETELLSDVDFAAADVLTLIYLLQPALPPQLKEAVITLTEARYAVWLHRNHLIAQQAGDTLQLN